MQIRLGRTFLWGAAMMAMAAPIAAQGARTASQPAKYPLEVAISYNATSSGLSTGNKLWMQGGSVQVHGRFYGGWGVVADVSGAHIANISSTGVGLDMVIATFGPRYTWSPARRKYEFFGQGLAGQAWGFNGVFPNFTGATTDSSSLAVQTGGGMNFNLSPRLALRAFEADYLRTQLPNATNNVQNNLRLGAGIVFRFR
jgi:outer membrane immunogenic protein